MAGRWKDGARLLKWVYQGRVIISSSPALAKSFVRKVEHITRQVPVPPAKNQRSRSARLGSGKLGRQMSSCCEDSTRYINAAVSKPSVHCNTTFQWHFLENPQVSAKIILVCQFSLPLSFRWVGDPILPQRECASIPKTQIFPGQ